MKDLVKNSVALLLSSSMVLGMAASAGAASAGTYSVQVNDKTISFVANGKTASSYTAKNTDIKLMTDDDGDLLVCFYAKDGKYKGVNLDGQSSVTLDGSISTLTLSNTLNNDVDINLGSSAKVKKMQINSQSDVTVKGKVTDLTAAAGASIRVLGEGVVSSADLISRKATIYAEAGAKVSKVKTESRSSTSGDGIGQVYLNYDGDYNYDYSDAFDDFDDDDDDYFRRRNRYYYDDDDDYYYWRHWYDNKDYDDYYDDYYTNRQSPELKIRSIDATKGTKLKKLVGDLEDNVRAYVESDYGDRREIKGKFTWVKDDDTRVNETGEYRFVFTPNNTRRYRVVRDSVTINIDD